MPNYTFRCLECGAEFEHWFSFYEAVRPPQCPNGHGQVERIYRAPAIVFKGSGFYVTDNRTSNSASKSNGRNGKPDEKTTASEAKKGTSSEDTL